MIHHLGASMRSVLFLSALVSVLAAPRAAAQDPVSAPAEAPASDAAAPPAEAPAPPDPLKVAFDLVEVQADTRANLEKAVSLYTSALKDEAVPAPARVAAYTDLSRAWLRLGNLEKTDSAKIKAYENGRAAAQKAIALDARYADAHFWDAANQACIGRTKGVMNSLFMLGDLKKGLNRALELDPGHKIARQTLGEIDHAVPGFAGGSDERAEKAYLENLRRDPNFTPSMLLLARLYRDQGKEEEARKWAQKILDTRSSVPHDWRKFDKPEAQRILKELAD